jgi:two-component system sensor histidine kinase RegB
MSAGPLELEGAIRPPARPVAGTPSDAVLRWLIPLRFLAAAGQAAALVVGRFWLELPLPYAVLWWVPALTVISNLVLRSLSRRGALPAKRLVLPVLLFDCLLFTFLLQWSGGPDNPFSALYAIHIAMAAMTGSAAATWTVAAAATLGYALVFRWHEVQHFWHAPVAPGDRVGLHAIGMWVAVAVVALVITYFISRVMRSLRERDVEMLRLGEIAARNARLASLTTLAAGAAHELGSPLGTIAVIAHELERSAGSTPVPGSLAEDARLLRSEVERCRSILDRMRARAATEATGGPTPLACEDAIAAVREALGSSAAGRVSGRVDAAPGTRLGAKSDFLSVVLPIVRNAIDASPEDGEVHLAVSVESGVLRVVTRDEGHGMDPVTLSRAGEPFFTTRAPGLGTGLGLFVVNLEVERLGGAMRLSSSPGRGTTVVVEWPLADAPEASGERGRERLLAS